MTQKNKIKESVNTVYPIQLDRICNSTAREILRHAVAVLEKARVTAKGETKEEKEDEA